jgi:Ca2+-binding RTX toxin-like protein
MAFAIGAFVSMSGDDDTVEETEPNGGPTEIGPETSTSFFGLFDDDDDVDGSEGNDTLYGGGKDTLSGGAGSDGLDGENGNDSLHGGAGPDVLQGGYGNDFLVGGSEDDFLQGESNHDTLNGGAGNDGLHGGNGADSLNGGSGDDLLNGASLCIDDALLEEWLDDFNSGQSTTSLGDERSVIVDDYIGDQLDGGEGQDTLVGGAFDVLTGGDCSDEFVAGAWSTSGYAATVTDFDTNQDMMVYRYDETSAEPEMTMNSVVASDGSVNVEIFADGISVLMLQNTGPDFDLSAHVTLVASPIAHVST